MPTIIIHGSEGRAKRYHPPEGSILVGRGEDADLNLANVSVSREHARLHVAGEKVELEDLRSRNGVRVGGEKLPEGGRVVIEPGQEVRIGKFRLTLLPEGETFFQGRFVEYLPEHSETGGGTQAATYAMSAAEALQYEEDSRRIRESRVLLASNRRRFWHPEDRSLTFGGKGMIPVDGLFTGGLLAEIKWEARSHTLTKVGGFMATVKVNGEKVDKRALVDGDTFQVGNTSFVFECPKA